MEWALLTLGVVVVGFVAVGSTRATTMSSVLGRARKTGEVEAIVSLIEKMSSERQPTGWNHAIESLWRSYHRETAALLIVQGALRHDADILQYWIQQTMMVEPEIAEAHFTPEFLQTCFRPQVAASCGRSGCCG